MVPKAWWSAKSSASETKGRVSLSLWRDSEGDLGEHPAGSKGLDRRAWEVRWGPLGCTELQNGKISRWKTRRTVALV